MLVNLASASLRGQLFAINVYRRATHAEIAPYLDVRQRQLDRNIDLVVWQDA